MSLEIGYYHMLAEVVLHELVGDCWKEGKNPSLVRDIFAAAEEHHDRVNGSIDHLTDKEYEMRSCERIAYQIGQVNKYLHNDVVPSNIFRDFLSDSYIEPYV